MSIFWITSYMFSAPRECMRHYMMHCKIIYSVDFNGQWEKLNLCSLANQQQQHAVCVSERSIPQQHNLVCVCICTTLTFILNSAWWYPGSIPHVSPTPLKSSREEAHKIGNTKTVDKILYDAKAKVVNSCKNFFIVLHKVCFPFYNTAVLFSFIRAWSRVLEPSKGAVIIIPWKRLCLYARSLWFRLSVVYKRQQ